MRKLFTIVLLACIVFSCSEEKVIYDSPAKLYPVKFTPALQFDMTEVPLSKVVTDTMSPYPDSISYQYLVYDASGNAVKSLSGFGNVIEDSLSAGSYKIAIAASKDIRFLDYKIYPRHYNSDTISFPELYYHTFLYEVSENPVADTSNYVYLNKNWGEIELEVLDRATCYIPENVMQISFETVGKASLFYIKNGEGLQMSYKHFTDFSVADFRKAEVIKCLKSYSAYPVEVSVIFRYGDGTPDKKIHLATIGVKKGVKTFLKGNLGDELAPSSPVRNSIRFSVQEQWQNETMEF